MSGKRYVLMLVLVVVAAFLGGALSVRLMAAEPAAAQPAAPEAKVIETKGIRLVDGQGALRASLWVHEDGQPALTLWDSAGVARAALRLDERGEPALDLWGQQRSLHASFNLSDGAPGVAVYQGGVLRAWLAVINGQPSVQLWDQEGRRVPAAP